jgi:hypothetical protein
MSAYAIEQRRGRLSRGHELFLRDQAANHQRSGGLLRAVSRCRLCGVHRELPFPAGIRGIE